ncbi:thioredoxin reductase [bacterium BMS3Abin05]|nr:thioredoxin reductase [bacterium BMS3Abin05]GBE27682.1 thioredoxin reductase [bacterium BMS3Bbin03]
MPGLSFHIGKADELKGKDYDVVILGAGPAGLTAAIYAGRGKLNTLAVEKEAIGGEAASTDWIDNFPGFPDGVGGVDLSEKMEKQARRFGASILYGDVKDLDLRSQPKTMLVNGEPVTAKTVIIATGTHPKELGVPGEKELKGRGVSYCATCDAPFFKDKDIAVIGGGNSGLQESLFLLKYVKSIKVIEFLPRLTAEPILQDKVLENKNVEAMPYHRLVSINGKEKVTSITVENRSTKDTFDIKVGGVFVYVGLDPNTDFLNGTVKLNKWGFIEVSQDMETDIPGVFAAGDVRDTRVRQVATAVGDGAHAAVVALKFIEDLD